MTHTKKEEKEKKYCRALKVDFFSNIYDLLVKLFYQGWKLNISCNNVG